MDAVSSTEGTRSSLLSHEPRLGEAQVEPEIDEAVRCFFRGNEGATEAKGSLNSAGGQRDIFRYHIPSVGVGASSSSSGVPLGLEEGNVVGLVAWRVECGVDAYGCISGLGIGGSGLLGMRERL